MGGFTHLCFGEDEMCVLLELLLPVELTLSSLGGFPGWILLPQP